MMRILNFLKKFSVREWILAVMVIVLSIAFVQVYFNDRTIIKTVLEESNQYKNKANEEYRAKTILLQDVKDLRDSNDSLYAEYKKLEKSKPLVITKTLVETVVDSIEIPTVVEKKDGGKYSIKWNYDEKFDVNNYLSINGFSEMDSASVTATTTIERFLIGSDLYLNLIESNSDNSLRIIARSNNPYIHFSDIQGAVIDPTKNNMIKKCFPKKRWGVGVGFGAGVGYDVNSKKINVGPQLTVGLQYNILTW